MAGGLFSIDRDYFYQIGAYDTGMDIWGTTTIALKFVVKFLLIDFIMTWIINYFQVERIWKWVFGYVYQLQS